jgi:nickel-dependent lactate racemase
MVTALSESIVASCFAQKASSLSAAIEMAIAQQGPEAKFIIMPEGSIAAPVIL